MSISELMRLDGRLLTAFCVVAQELHFGRAAARLHISQPPLSQHIKRLEQLVGTPLLIRSTRSVRLTAAGAVMYRHAQQISSDIETMLLQVRQVARSDTGTLTVGITASAAQTPLVQALRDYSTAHAAVKLELHDMDSVDMLPALRLRQIDIALMRPYMLHPEINMHVIYQEPIGVVTPHGALIGGPQVSLAQLARYPLIGYTESHSPYFRNLVQGLFERAGVTPHIIQENRLPSILTLVEVGAGYAIVPWSMAKTHSETLQFIPIKEAAACRAETVIATMKDQLNPLAEDLMANLVAHPKLRVDG